MAIKVLILEDEFPIRSFIKENLMFNNFETVEAESGEQALEIFEKTEEKIDIALLDVMLPGISGIDVCKKLREKNPDMGIIMLTAKGTDADKVLGFGCGADDYIVKPFSPIELIARINALYRRVSKMSKEKFTNEIKFAHFLLDLDKKRFFKEDEEIILTPTEFEIIRLFMENPNKALSRDDIMDRVWGKNCIIDLKVLDVNIRRIRRKVELNPSSPKHIETVWGYGYCFRGEE
ncbi:response regulator transcription factor [Peptostreptococcaceae bacterium AGR-M142]